MAKKNQQHEETSETESGEPSEVVAGNLPDGFDPVGASGPQAWAIKEPGAMVQGILVGHFTKKSGKKGRAFQIKLTKAAKTIFNKEPHIAQPNDVVCVDESKALEELVPLATDGGRYEVFIKYVEHRTMDDGNTFWAIQVGKKVIQPPPAPVAGNTIPY